MRLGAMIAVAVAMLGAGQAKAADTFQVSIGGYVFGTITNYTCADRSQIFCPVRSEYGEQVSFGPVSSTLAEGENPFFYQANGAIFSGTIINRDRLLTGVNLSYTFTTCSRLGGPSFGCYDVAATAPTFVVGGGVPEPATWALMLAGFGLVGHTLRRRKAAYGQRQAALS